MANMSKELVATVRADLESIRKQLAAYDGLKKREAQLVAILPALLALYAPEELEQEAPKAAAAPSPPPLQRRLVLQPPAVSQKDRILEAAASVFMKMGPLKSRDMLQHIEAAGVHVGGADKVGALSAILSKSDRFESDRAAGGWVLVSTPQKEEAPRGIDAPAGPSV
jgi:hypothetical protein